MAARRKKDSFFSKIRQKEGVDFELDRFIPAGKVTKAHGIKGEIKVFPFFGYPDDFKIFSEIVLVKDTEQVFFTLSSSRPQGNIAILRLDGIDNREDAESLRDYEVWVDKELLPELPENEVYWHEIEGYRVLTEEGVSLGKVTEKFSNGAHDIIVVTGTGREYLIPFLPEFIAQKDDDKGELVISPPPGLLEIND